MKVLGILVLILGVLSWMNRDEIAVFISGIYDKYDDYFIRWGKSLGLDPKILKAIAANESSIGKNLGTELIGNTKGLMHVTFPIAKYYLPELNLKDGDHKNLTIDQDLKAGGSFLRDLINKYPGSLKSAVRAYNGGEPRENQIIAYERTGVFKPLTSTDTLDKFLKAKSNMDEYWSRFNRHLDKIGNKAA